MKRLLILLTVLAMPAVAGAQKYYSIEDSKWKISLGGGYSRRIAIFDEDSMDPVLYMHNKKLLGGFSGSAEVTYFTSQTGGFGLKFNEFRASNDELVTVTYEDGSQKSGTMDETIDLFFIGPVGTFRKLSTFGERAFIFSFGYGLVGERDNLLLIDDKYLMNGFTTGYLLELGYDFTVSDHFAIGASLNAIAASLSSYNLTDDSGQTQTVKLDKDSYEGLMHVNFQIGIRYYL